MTRNSDTESVVRFVVESLVDHPEDVGIEVKEDGDRVVYEITTNPEDTGKVIGRQGRIIKALRTLTRAAGSVDGTQVEVEVLG